MKTSSTPVSKEACHAQNEIAAVLGASFPGWSHLQRPLRGWPSVDVSRNAISNLIGILLGLATAGIGLLFAILCWVGLRGMLTMKKTDAIII